MNKILLLIDNNVEKSDFWLGGELKKSGFEVRVLGIANYDMKNRTTKHGQLILWMQYFVLALRAMYYSKPDEIVVSWNGVVGMFCAFLNSLSTRGRKILTLNLIIHEKGFLNTVVRSFIYSKSTKDKNCYVTLNAEYLSTYYREKFNLQIHRYYVLNDVLDPHDRVHEFQNGDGTVFCGGEARRDWGMMLDAAKDLPEINFVFVARRKGFMLRPVPANVTLFFDLSHIEFYGLLRKSSMVALPLNSMAPAGLIVLIKSALLCKPVIITETPSTIAYIRHNETGMLIPMKGLKELKDAIKVLHSDDFQQKRLAEALQKRIVNHYSTAAYVKQLQEILVDVASC